MSVSYQLSDQTVRLLKNFAGVSSSLLLSEGRAQRTVAASHSVLATAQFPDPWPKETAIFNLNTFLGTLSLFKTPGIVFDEDAMEITQGASRVRYRYSDPTTITAPPNKTLPVDNAEASVNVPATALQQLVKTCLQLELTTITLALEGGRATFRAHDHKNVNSHAFEYDVPEADMQALAGDVEDKVLHFKQEHFQMLLDGEYTVSVGPWNYAHFVHKTEPISYHIVGQKIIA